MSNQHNLNESSNPKQNKIIQGMRKNKRELVKRYGSKAEEVMYKRAKKLAEQHGIMENNKLREMVRAALSEKSQQFTDEYDNNPVLKGKQKKLPDALQKAIIQKSENVDEAIGTKIKAGIAAAKTGFQNIKKAYKGEGGLESPKLAAQKVKLQTTTQNLDKALQSTLKDIDSLFSAKSLESNPTLKKAIDQLKTAISTTSSITKKIETTDLTKTSTPDQTEKPEAEKPEAEKPEAEKPEAKKPEAKKPEATTTSSSSPSLKTNKGSYIKGGVAYNKDGKKLTGNEEKQVMAAITSKLKTKGGSYVKDGVAYNKDNKKLTGDAAKQVTAAIEKLKNNLEEYIITSKSKIVNEDLDLGHEDDEPHMIKGELYQIGKYAMIMYHLVDQFEGKGEVDFPAWWQSKITSAKTMLSGAKHYLEFELNEPQVDAVVNSFFDGEESFDDGEDMMNEKLKPSMGVGAYVKDFKKSKAPQFKGKSKEKKNKMAIAAYLSAKDNKAIVEKIKDKITKKLKETL